MAQEYFDIPANPSGLSESPEWTMENDGEVNVVYEAERCVSAWIEYKYKEDDREITRKIPIMPMQRNGSTSSRMIPQGATAKIIASVGRRGYLRAHVFH